MCCERYKMLHDLMIDFFPSVSVVVAGWIGCWLLRFGLDQAVLRLQLIKNIMNVDIVNLMIIYLDIRC